MVFDVDGEALLARFERDALRHRPAGQRPVALEAEVVVQAARVVPLDDEDRLLPRLLRAEGLGRLLRVALAFVLPERARALLSRRDPSFPSVRRSWP
jgi:hypothetical protein